MPGEEVRALSVPSDTLVGVAVRWVWNHCVADSKATHAHNRAHPGEKRTCGAARLDRRLTSWRAEHGRKAAARLARYHSRMARRRPPRGQAASKGYRTARRQAARLHARVRAQRTDTARKWAERVVRDHDALAVEDFRPGFPARTTMARKAADAAIAATKRALVEMGREHGRDVRLVNPQYTTMDCGGCGARAKHALPLSERTYWCTTCGSVCPRDRNSARVVLVRAGLDPAGVEGARPARPPDEQAV
ncbi:RNA-guided endonuclease TnpB family protein [Saccharothrix lopnurensis]|uniref:RNA-guided endonuclease TnpB family protein n=1 Tax=Saccharothrix lopnurensis TaxID=1670621 RepID=UPI0036D290E0